MRITPLLVATAIGVCWVPACSSPGASTSRAGAATAGPSTADPTAVGPLGGPALGGDICWGPRRGQLLTSGELIDKNSSPVPVTLTRAWLTGIRALTLDATYAHIVHPGTTSTLGDAAGWPPAGFRHPVAGTIVPPGGYVEILFTVTAGSPAAFANGQDVSYTSQGRSYTQANPWRIGYGPHC